MKMKQCQTWCKGIPYAFLLFMAAAFAGRAFLGFDWSDESMYLALPYRFVLGDRPFLDSWDSHQLWGLLMVPAVKGYLLLFGSMDGAILFFRIAFVLFQGIVAVLAYQIILRLTGRRFPSFVAAAIFFAFTPSSISAFSPMTVSSCFMMLSALLSLVMAGRLSKRLKLCGFLSGLCFAVSSFSYPLFLIALPCYLALPLFLTPDLEKGKNGRAAMALSFLAGCALTWMAVTVYLIAAIGFYPALKGIVSSFALKSFHHLAESTSLFLKDYYHLVLFALLQVTLLFCILLGKISNLPAAAYIFQFLVNTRSSVFASFCKLLSF